MTHGEAKREVQTIYDQTTQLVGDGWDKPDGLWGVCTLADGSEGDTWSAFNQRYGPLAGTPAEVAERVQVLWSKLGYDVDIVRDDNMTPPRHVLSYPPYLTGTTPDGFGIVFTLGTNYADISTDSRCVPGTISH